MFKMKFKWPQNDIEEEYNMKTGMYDTWYRFKGSENKAVDIE